ncbi:beta-lactamase regulator AmpE [Klebsiella pneumoniae subsp. pneumoniae]|nr:beta-lactamase regulator AmpE [Klebsiella pneumoniae subsp. pneumoniae]
MRCCGLTIDTIWRRFSGLSGGAWGPLTLIAYSVLRAWQTWLARYQTAAPPVAVRDRWYPAYCGLAAGASGGGVVYALVGHGEKALPAWFASLGDRHSSQYQVLTRLAQYSLAREPHVDKVATPKAAVSMAKKTSLVVVVIMALLTIYGTLV